MDDRITLSRAKYGWTKYGGGRHGLVKHKGQWYCQSCGEEQPDSLPAYMFNTDNGLYREFVRLCAKCENIAKKKKVKQLKVLIRITRIERF